MIRKAFVMSLHPGREVEYERRHSPIWPELEQTLKQHGVHNYSIFLLPATAKPSDSFSSATLVGYVEIEDESRWAAIADTEICRKWWAYMREIMASNPDNSPIALEAREVFHLT